MELALCAAAIFVVSAVVVYVVSVFGTRQKTYEEAVAEARRRTLEEDAAHQQARQHHKRPSETHLSVSAPSAKRDTGLTYVTSSGPVLLGGTANFGPMLRTRRAKSGRVTSAKVWMKLPEVPDFFGISARKCGSVRCQMNSVVLLAKRESTWNCLAANPGQ
ncbi:hypothetical protein HPB50_004950 [Hyalomma asiaticum]|uniref:Uncharacterized protein n=1 Tax=Hyalomma asiaticum TaxID=266040 RepID=A0ACB7RY15_HYAAI|nr:hypothetical protein HPB50_004950 [Hyalomma asiaticum]